MMTKDEVLELLESYKRCQIDAESDMYWSGAIIALKEVLEK